jgi:pilus assembly protein CpaC
MHRTRRVSRSVRWGALLGLVLACTAGRLLAQAPEAGPPPRPNPNALIIAINATQRVGMTTGKALKQAVNEKENIARVQPIQGDPTRVLITGLEPGITRVTLTDVDNKSESFDVVVQFDVEYLKSLLKRAVPTANVQPIPGANNTIILTGTVAHAEDVDVVLRTAQSVVLGGDRIINALRVGGVMQVQLCVVIAQVSRSEFRRMAFDFLAGDRDWFWASTGSNAVGTPTLIGRGSAQLGPNGALSGPPGLANGAPSNLFLGVLRENSGFIGFLQALRDENVAKLLAEPRLVTMSGRPASFLSGGEQAVPIPAGLGQVGIQFEEFGTRLNFLPIVLGNGRIHLEVEPEVSQLDAANGTNIQGTVVPGRVTQRVHTTVELEDGQTFVLGGLIQRENFGTARKVPVLGDLPFIGTAFRSVGHDERERELVVMVTVHLVDPLDCSQLPKYLPGQETRSPDDFELFLEGILEAPRGPRSLCGGENHYTPAYKNSPSAGVYPCAGSPFGGCAGGSCPTGGCNGYGTPGGVIGAGATGLPAGEVTPVGSREIVPPPTPMGARPTNLPMDPQTGVDGQR